MPVSAPCSRVEDRAPDAAAAPPDVQAARPFDDEP